MSQSLAKIYMHTIFSTKHRVKCITPDVEIDLHNYIGGTCREIECYPVRVGGYYDHVHLLTLLSKKITVSQFVQKVKTSSSKWLKEFNSRFQNFHWQDGYAAFSVGSREIDIVRNYVENQCEHHRQKTFQDEVRVILTEQGIDFDERYIWD